MSTEPRHDPLIGTTVSQFEILAKLGGGGMGVVYKARDLKLGRVVALKFLPPQWSHDEGAKQRFIREAQAASATQHKNICTIHDIGEAADGRLFIVMACYDGETLKQRLARGALPIADALQIGLEIAEGLAKAHSQGVVHRDIKPGNIILTDDGVKIVDFGLAKFADALQLTVPGTTIGTVAYMSPEQARGEEADAQSDVWAWGIVMYQMLTGAPPYRGPYPEATFHAIKHEPLPPMRTARPEIPEPVEQVVLPALEKDRAHRYTSAREAARALRLLQGMTLPIDLRTQSVVVPPKGSGAPARRAAGAFRVAWLAAALAVMALGGLGWWRWTTRAIARVPVAIVPVANHTGVADLDRYRLALTETLTEALADSPNLSVVPYLRLLESVRPFVLRGGDVSSSDAVQAIAASTRAPFLIVPALIYRDRDSTWLMQVQVRSAATGTTVATYETAPVTSSLSQQTAFQLTAAAAGQVQQHFKDQGPGRSFTTTEAGAARNRDAALAFEAGLNAYEAMEYRAAADAFAQATGLDDQYALGFAWQARTLTVLGRKGEAVTAARRGQTLAASAADAAARLFVAAVAAETTDDPAAAEPAYRRLVSERPDVPWMRVELADYLKRRQDRNPQAIEAYHDVLKVDPAYIRVHVDLCQLYARIDDFPLADREGQAARDGAQQAGNPSVEAQALLCLAESQRRSRRSFDDARRLAADARRTIESLNQPYNLARAMFYQASMEYSAGQFPAAAERFAEAASRLNETGNRTMEATALMNLGIVRLYTGQPTETLDLFARSSVAMAAIGDERRAAEMEVSRAGLQINYGLDLDEARRSLRNARTNLEKMGHVDFQLGAMQFEAEADRYAGRLVQARQLMRAALAQANDKRLSFRIAGLKSALAQLALETGGYDEVLTLMQAADAGAGADLPIVEGTARMRLGDADGAAAALERARSVLQQSGDQTAAPSLETALGELALERQAPGEAIRHFEAAIGLWRDPLLPAAVVAAHCGRGTAEAALGRIDRARQAFALGQAAADKLHRVIVAAQCRADHARVEVLQKNYASAVAILAPVPDESAAQTIGEPLRVSVEYWRARALRGLRDPSAPQRTKDASARLVAWRDSVPAAYRERFVTRPGIREMLGDPAMPVAGAR